MNHKIIALMAVVMLSVTGVTTIGIASAQSAGNTTATPVETSTNSGGSGDNSTSVTKISKSVTLTDYRFEGDTVILTIEADYSQPMVLSDMFVSSTGASRIPQKDTMLSEGKNRLSFETTEWKGTQGVVVGANGGAIAVSQKTGGFSFNSEYSAETLVGSFVVAVLTGIGLVLAIAYRKEIKYTSNVHREV